MSNCKIVNFWFTRNYGAILTCYALQQTLTYMGHKAEVVNMMNATWQNIYKGSFSEDFAVSHLNLTKFYASEEELVSLNADTDNFIVGSDQVFRYRYYNMHGYIPYLLAFVSPEKRKIACSASFGLLEHDAPTAESEIFKYNLMQFEGVSVREDAGVDILSRLGIKATQIIDPVFYLNTDLWKNLAEENTDYTSEDNIVYFSLPYDAASSNPPVLSYLEQKLKTKIDIQEFNTSRKVVTWLDSIRKAKFIVTDSFHGTCFAIIFHKPFVVLSSYPEMRSRMDQILRMLGLEDRIISPDQDSNFDFLLKDIDWKHIDDILFGERNRALKWLQQHLNAPIKDKPNDSIILNMLWRRSQQERSIAKKIISSMNNRNVYDRSTIDKYVIFIKYYRYKILSKITGGKTRKRYVEKRSQYHDMVRQIRESRHR